MHIYFSGIGGTGLSPLANLCLDLGYNVSGSDTQHSKNIIELVERNAKINLEQSLEEIISLHSSNPIDWIVVTSALPENHPHLIFAQDNNIKITKRGKLINFILLDKNLELIAVSGTHGKTTVTGMLIWCFKKLNIPVSYLIGTNINYGKSGEFQISSKYFVYECDEFDRNFLNFEPEIAVLPYFDYDHPDTYPTQLDYSQAFAKFADQTKFKVLGYQEDFENANIIIDSKIQAYTRNPAELSQKNIKLAGQSTRENAFLVVELLKIIIKKENIAISEAKILEAINSFPGTERRFQTIIPNLISDYGHHPTEIQATLQIAKETLILKNEDNNNETKNTNQNSAKIVLVYQPHQNIRQHDPDIQQGYQKCFEQADIVYWLPTYLSREYSDLEILSPLDIIKKSGINNYINNNLKFIVSELDNDLKTKIQKHLDARDLVIAMGAGDIDNWINQEFVD